ncbi:MAG TPA: nidogen-like domain-containing protein, partial [Bacteroidia bacterium]
MLKSKTYKDFFKGSWLIHFLLLIPAFNFAQSRNPVTSDPVQYELMKRQGLAPELRPTGKMRNDTIRYVPQPNWKVDHHQVITSASCNCNIPRDGSFQVVPFQFATGPDYRNDDGSSPAINLPFNFCFYGQQFNVCYINNNGNISFGQSYSSFSSSAFPSNQYVMVAPFWADVDTRSPNSGLVYYKLTPTALIVKWDSVGYYAMHDDKLNTFQLIITDGNDPMVPNGNNVSFCYGDMQWTTGDASSGSNGFNSGNPSAIPATVGANLGNGIDYVQFGRFGQPGTFYSGPNPSGPNYEGVSWLDNQSLVFNACANNIPPVPSGITACDTMTVCEGDTLDFNINFASPEITQITTASYSAPGLLGVNMISNTSGNSANIHVQLIANGANVGYNTITFTGTDNGTPPMTTNVSIVILVDTFSAPPPVISGNSFYCTGGTGVQLNCSNNNYSSFLWSTGATTQNINNATAGTYYCTVQYNGCYKTDSFTVGVYPNPTPVITGA